ncbi:MAG: glutathione peroxidase [Pedosphaera sp. Tous-C6FEB]|nr:MAG: glutathione peroxidase [Pedosphaera sp. Tous-C6FEB]
MKLALTLLACLFAQLAAAQTKPLTDIPLTDLAGQATSLKPYAGKVLLIVNVASQCGATPQYGGLEQLHKQHGPRGLAVLGFPCNDFGAQEPGTAAEIKQFCTTNYKVTFPLFAKTRIADGPEQHPLFAALTGKGSPLPGPVTWNFSKFLVGRDGKLLARFDSNTEPDDDALVKAIEKALAAK